MQGSHTNTEQPSRAKRVEYAVRWKWLTPEWVLSTDYWGSLSTKWNRHCWEPEGLPGDLTGHGLTSWHSLSRAPESGSGCRTKESSHQQREATHHWPTWETLDDTCISCRHQGKRSAEPRLLEMPAAATQLRVPHVDRSGHYLPVDPREQPRVEQTQLPLYTHNHCLKIAENLGWKFKRKLEQSSPKTGLSRVNYWLGLRFEVDCVFSYFLLI